MNNSMAAICGVVAFVMFGVGRLRHWNAGQYVINISAGVVCTYVAILAAALAGLLSPVDAMVSQWKADALEHRLYVGESRSELEHQFGNAIPRPDHFGGYSVSGAQAVPGWADHLGQYSYYAGGNFCLPRSGHQARLDPTHSALNEA